MEIIYKNINDLIPYANNTRTHSEEQVNQIASSIKEFGFTNPLLIDEEDGIIAGHGRLMGAMKLNMDEVPCIVLSNLIEASINTFVGFLVSILLAYTVLPLYGMEQSLNYSLQITLIFTVASILRNYFIRRAFNMAIVWIDEEGQDKPQEVSTNGKTK